MSLRLSVALLFAALSTLAQAQADPATPPAAERKAADEIKLPPLPADRTVDQSATIGGRLLRYKATVGHIDVRDDKGKVIGQVV